MTKRTRLIIAFSLLGFLILRELGIVNMNYFSTKSDSFPILADIQNHSLASNGLDIQLQSEKGKILDQFVSGNGGKSIKVVIDEFSGINYTNFNLFRKEIEPTIRFECFDSNSNAFLGGIEIKEIIKVKGLCSLIYFKRKLQKEYFEKLSRILIDKAKYLRALPNAKGKTRCSNTILFEIFGGDKPDRKFTPLKREFCILNSADSVTIDTFPYHTFNNGIDSLFKFEIIRINRNTGIMNLSRFYNNDQMALNAHYTDCWSVIAASEINNGEYNSSTACPFGNWEYYDADGNSIHSYDYSNF